MLPSVRMIHFLFYRTSTADRGRAISNRLLTHATRCSYSVECRRLSVVIFFYLLLRLEWGASLTEGQRDSVPHTTAADNGRSSWVRRSKRGHSTGGGGIHRTTSGRPGGLQGEENAYRRARAFWSRPTAVGMGRGGKYGNSGGYKIGDGSRRRMTGTTAAGSTDDELMHARRNQQLRHQQHQRYQQRCEVSVSPPRAASVGRIRTAGRRSPLAPRHQHRGPHCRTRSEITPENTAERKRRNRVERGVGRHRQDGGGRESEEEDFRGWLSAPECGSNRGAGGRRTNGWALGTSPVGHGSNGASSSEWRGRGALGRRPPTREAARQLRVSERLHRLGLALAKKKESARRRRDDLQSARVSIYGDGVCHYC